jgi:hypothetical protein
VSAAVDAFPRGGGQPGGQPPAGAEAKLERLIDQVSPPVVQDRAGRFGAGPPRAGWCVPAHGTFNQDRLADQSVGQKLLDGQKIPVPAPVVKDRQQASGPIAGGDHPIRIKCVERHHLFDDAMFTGIEGPDSERGMAVVRGGDHDQFDSGVSQGVVKVSVASDVVTPQADRFGTHPRVASNDPVQPEPRLASDQRAVKRPTRQAMANHNRSDHRRCSGLGEEVGSPS